MSLSICIFSRLHGPGPSVLDLIAAASSFNSSEHALLHSADDIGHSVLALSPLHTIEITNDSHAAPLAALQEQLDAFTFLGETTVPLVGWIGALSYDLGRHLEAIPNRATNDMHWPLARFTLFQHYFVLDHTTNAWTLVTLQFPTDTSDAATQLDTMERFLKSVPHAADLQVMSQPPAPTELLESLSKPEYIAQVERVKQFIAAGDIYQANLAQRWTLRTTLTPLNIYRRLAQRSPAPYAAFLQWQDRAIISASPELFLDRQDNLLETRPIKGTRPRSIDPVLDVQLRDELLTSTKDHAELAMIVDLLRNDLGRISQFGSVHVTDPRLLQAHPTVWHTLAIINGQARHGVSWAEILAALTPGGSITGAPKIRAMQIIEELEPTRRGFYCGNIGWIGPHNTGTLNITIRTILMKGQTAWIHAGGGVVADSDPAAEYAETKTKAAALFFSLQCSPPER